MHLVLTRYKNAWSTGGGIRTPINGFGDRHATIAPHPCIEALAGIEPT